MLSTLTAILRQLTQSRAWPALMLMLACLPLLPFIIMGGNSHFSIADNLDGDLALMRAMADHGDLLSLSGSMDYVMNGLPRGAGRTGYNLTSLLFAVFSTPTAYILNYIFSHLVAFFGMTLLLRRHFITEKEMQWLPPVMGVLFSAVSWFSMYGWFVAGQPLLLWAFLNLLKNQQTWKDWAIIAVYPFTAAFILIGPFLFAGLLCIAGWHFFQGRGIHWKFLLGAGLMLVLFLLSDAGMFYETFLAKSFVSHRTEWPLPKMVGLKAGFFRAAGAMMFTHFHAGMFMTKLMWAAAALVVSLRIADGRWRLWLLAIPAMIFFICLVQAFYPAVVHLLGAKISLLKTVQLDRFYNLIPLLWMIYFALLVRELWAVAGLRFVTVALLAMQLLAIHSENRELNETLKRMTGKPADLSANQYLASGQFESIKKHINKPLESYRVASLGLEPSIALHNGFYCLDAYVSNYDLAYKQEWRKIISGELGKMTPEQRKYFDEWGSRCYLFAAELNLNFRVGKEAGIRIAQPAFDWNLLKQKGCRYLISGVEIVNPDPMVLQFEKRFSDPASAWEIYLYRLQ